MLWHLMGRFVGSLLLVLAGTSGCDVLVGFPDVPAVADSGDGATAGGTDSGPRKDAKSDGRPKDARADVRDGTLGHDARVPDAHPPVDSAVDSPLHASDASCSCECQGGTLIDAGCLMVLAADIGPANDIALDPTSVYWVSYGQPGFVGRTPRSPVDGGQAVTLAPSQEHAFRLTVNGGYVYWVNLGPVTDAGTFIKGAVARVATDGGTAATLVGGLTTPYGVAVIGQEIYFSQDVNGGAVETASTLGGNPTFVSQPTAGVFSWDVVADNGGSLYWTTFSPGTGMGTIFVKSPLEARVLAMGSYEPWAVAVANGYVAWVTRAAGASGVSVIYADGGSPAELAAFDGGLVSGVAIDDQFIYWTETTGALIMRVPIAGGAAATVYATEPTAAPTGIAVDDASVYWGEQGTGRIMKLTPK
jgi:hypothetical protein